MSSTKSVLVLIGLGVLGANVVVGCSSTTGEGFEDLDDSGLGAALPETGTPQGDSSPPVKQDASFNDAPLVPGDSGADAKASDGSTGDAAADATVDAEAGVDASLPDAGAEGGPCPTNNLVAQQTCGLCGYQTRLCAPSDPANPASPLAWQPWGFCQSEVEDGCVPGTSTTDSCGMCGTRQKVCQIDCQYAVGACKNEPPNACQPGKVEYQEGLSCPEGGRSRTCGATCQYGSFGACFVQGEPTLTVSGTAGGKVVGEFSLPADVKTPRLSGTCPSGSVANDPTAYQYVVLKNPTASTLVLSVYTNESANAGAGYIDTVIASYGAAKPTSDTARKACVKGVNDGCTDPNDDADACNSSWGGLVNTNKITIGPNASVYIYVGAYYDDDSGDYQLIARTETVN